jgi:Protein of unknown function (DUF3160)
MLTSRVSPAAAVILGAFLSACGGKGATANKPPTFEGATVTAKLTAEQQAEADRLTALRNATAALTADELLAARAVPFRADLGYDPKTAKNLDLIQNSALRLDETELGVLSKNGFVISDKRRYPHFGYAYKTIYAQDLPVYVSADSILQAVHQSYDAILKAIETEALIPELKSLLSGMRTRLGANLTFDATTRKDVDLFLAVAQSLLEDRALGAVAGAADSEIQSLVGKAKAAAGTATLSLFGIANREIDFSQFKPRGHYTDSAELEKYFRAMMWLGRIDFPFLHTDENSGKQLLVRRSVAAAFALRALLDENAVTTWKRLDNTIRAFVGEPDSMTPLEIDRLKMDLGLAGDDVSSVSDDALTAAIVRGAYGKQKILSQIVLQAPHDGAWPLDATFLFFGQRYTFDSHVFSNVVYDRVSGDKKTGYTRMMPDPLDAAYAALGNDQAVKLLEPELKKSQPYVAGLEATRRLGDEHGAAFWNANLYNLWLGALRALSPNADIGKGAGLPEVARTEAWGRRILNTQLASWAELRHDTILYAKQSYTSGAACEFPDAYVDPYPAFFAKLEDFAKAGAAVVAELPLSSSSYLAPKIKTYFANLARITGILREMADLQRQGQPHKPEHLAFINEAVDTVPIGCVPPPGLKGWYADLFFDTNTALEFEPTIADVHTQPTDEGGTPVGNVLHVGTGWTRLFVTTINTCMGPRAYVGAAFSYHQLVTKDFERLDDPTWAKRFANQDGPAPDDVPWMQGLIAK